MAGLRDRLRRRWLPRLVVALARRQRSRPLPADAAIELYFAFDDPYAAIALPGLLALAEAERRPLQLYPLIERGIAGDPAAAKRAAHAVHDADRLARRSGRRLSRHTPLAAEAAAFLAAWTEAARGQPGMNAFAARAVEQLWLADGDGDEPPQPEAFAGLYRRLIGEVPPSPDAPLPATLAANTQRLRRLGHWESPAARLGGEWFFAHERLPQIAERLAQRRAPR